MVLNAGIDYCNQDGFCYQRFPNLLLLGDIILTISRSGVNLYPSAHSRLRNCCVGSAAAAGDGRSFSGVGISDTCAASPRDSHSDSDARPDIAAKPCSPSFRRVKAHPGAEPPWPCNGEAELHLSHHGRSETNEMGLRGEGPASLDSNSHRSSHAAQSEQTQLRPDS
jgi:hypothetical protein